MIPGSPSLLTPGGGRGKGAKNKNDKNLKIFNKCLELSDSCFKLELYFWNLEFQVLTLSACLSGYKFFLSCLGSKL